MVLRGGNDPIASATEMFTWPWMICRRVWRCEESDEFPVFSGRGVKCCVPSGTGAMAGNQFGPESNGNPAARNVLDFCQNGVFPPLCKISSNSFVASAKNRTYSRSDHDQARFII